MNTELRYYLSLLRRRLWLVGLVTGTLTALAVMVALTLPPVYRAEAVLLVESERIPGDLAVATVRTSTAEQLQIIEQRMLTRANMLELANRFRLYEGQRLDPTQIVEDMRARIRLRVDLGHNQATLVRLGFDAARPEVAAEVTNQLTSFILEENVALRTAIASQTVDFFRQEVQRLDRELETRSARILDFQLTHRDALPDNLPDLRSRQAGLEAEVNARTDALRQIASERDAAVETFERTGRIDVVIEDSFSPFLRRLSSLRDEYERAVAATGQTSERARSLAGRIAALERSLDAQLVAEGGSPGGLPAVFAHHLQRIDGRIAEIEAERAVLQERYEEIGARIQETLGNAATLDSLERDHATTREQHARALASVAAAETGDLIETLARGQRIAVIEAAVAPRQPTSPNRRLIVMMGAGAGIALSLGILLLLELANQTVRRPADLSKRLGIAPLATIPYMQTPGAASMHRAGSLGLKLALLGGIPAALYAVHAFYLPLDLLWRQTIGRLGLGPLLEQLRQSFGG